MGHRKLQIRKHEDRWVVIVPPFGFVTHHTARTFAYYLAACRWVGEYIDERSSAVSLSAQTESEDTYHWNKTLRSDRA